MPFYENEVTEVRLPAGSRANRAKRRRSRRIATVAILGLAVVALVVVPAARSWAHTIDVAVQEVCVEGKTFVDVTVNSQRGDYRFAGTATDGEGHSVPVNIPAGGASTTVRPGPVSGPGQVNVVGDFWKANGDKAEHMDRTVRYRLLDGCAPPPPPPPPPAKQGSAGVTTTCDSVTFNFGGADEGVEQYAKVDGKEKRPASRNGSVTFAGLAPGEHPVEYGSGKNVERGSFEALDCTPNASKKDEEFAGTATDQTRVEEDTPTVTTTPTPGTLPFTDSNRNVVLLTTGSSLVLAGALLLLLLDGRRRYQQLLQLAAEPRLVARATARAMAAEGRDGRDPNVLADMVARGRKVRDRLLGR